METRIALIGIIVENPESIEALNHLLHEYGKYIIGRMGIPYREREVNIISVAIDAPQDVINALSGKIGRLDGASSNPLRSFSLLGCRPISLITSHAHSEFAALQAEPARIRCASSRCWGCRPIRIKRKDDSLVNKFPILSSFLFILTRLVAYPKYLSSNP